ncbi:MAG TPA: fatty acid desaturase, partial [Phenylobacterium sp.]|nr:fatty acid desaturase [Phenylobacterium sp.]
TLAPYQRPSLARSVMEIAITVGPLAGLWGGALFAVSQGWWWAGLALSAPAAAFLVRLFMIQHDCGHSAFFRSGAANTWVGRIAGVLTMTPYDYWRRTHAIHHATSSNLDRRGLGGVETLTVEEYRALSPMRRLGYRLYRNAAVMLGLGPAYMFLLQHRLPIGLMKERRAWVSVLGNNLGLAVLVTVQVLIAGPQALLAVHLPIVVIAASIGVWLFFVQHQFEPGWWGRQAQWSLHDAAFRGSSHLDLPQPLRWMTANIGAHHLHHAASKIPFYRLPQVLRDHPHFHHVGRITLADALRAVRTALWDERSGRLVSFREARASA